MNNLKQLQVKCIERMEECYAIAEEHYGRSFTRIPVEFSSRLTKTGGYFRFNRFTAEAINIKLSSSILALNPEQFIAEVPGHELAHYIANEMYGPHIGHGFEWKQIMRLFGQSPNRCHNMETVKTNTFTYNVNGTVVELSKVRHNKIQRGYATYSLRGAGKILPSHWVRNNTVSQDFPPKAKRVPAPKAKSAGKKMTKANIARREMARMKAQGYDKNHVLGNNTLILHIAQAANLSRGLARTYIKNLWESA
jgi:SprT protein